MRTPEENMSLTIETTAGGVMIFRPSGRLDLNSGTEVRQELTRAIEEGQRRLVIDMAEVPFVDSSGLAALIGGLKAARLAGGDLRIARPGDQARVILDLTGLDRVLRGYATVEEAIAGFEE